MGVFSKVFKSRDSSRVRGQSTAAGSKSAATQAQKWEDAWTRKSVAPEEVQELLHVCTQEVKSRALEMPFVLLPFRPTSDQSAAKYFIRNFFKNSNGVNVQYDSQRLQHELKLIEPLVLCSIMKWCWSRLSGGVVTWNTYELFRVGELDSNMAKHAFDTFIPLSVESEAHKSIIFDFFDVLAATAANGKTNGLGGRKLSRLAGWWAFDHPDSGKGFNGGYKSWAAAADATCHLFFAYLRSLAPDSKPGTAGVSKLPRSLQALLSQTEYPPQTPELLLYRTSKVVMVVNSVSPTPYALLRRAKNFEYRNDDPVLEKFAQYSDPIAALTPECRRVLEAIATTNSRTFVVPERTVTSSPADASWSRFEDIGFSSLLDEPNAAGDGTSYSRVSGSDGLRPSGASGYTNVGRPATPSWADFLSSGFADDASSRGPPSLLLPPDQILPPLSPGRGHSSQSHLKGGLREDSLEPGELASVNQMDLDETFWWVWMTSLAAEEPPARKGVFGRCAFIETEIVGGRWLVLEEQVKGTELASEEGMFVVEKRNRFSSFTKRGRTRRESTGKRPPVPSMPYQQTISNVPQSRTTIGPDQQAKVQAAAAALVQQKKDEEEQASYVGRRRARTDEHADAKTTSVMTLQPVIMKEAGPAMQWARKFDKETIRQQYLGDNMAGKGLFRETSPTSSTLNIPTSLSAGDATALAKKDQVGHSETAPTVAPVQQTSQPIERSFPAAPSNEAPPLPLVKENPPLLPMAPPTREADPVPVEPTIVARPQTPVEATATPLVVDDRQNTPSNVTPVRRVGRKPVGSVDSTTQKQPAYHKHSNSGARAPETASKTSSEPNPAAIAAAGAFRKAQSQPSSPEAVKKAEVLQKSRKGSSRGLRTMFNRKKSQGTESTAAQKAMNGSALSAEQPKITRTPSFLRRKAAAEAQTTSGSAPPERSAPAPPQTEMKAVPVPTPAPLLDDIDDGEPGPVVTTDENEYAENVSTTAPAMSSPEANESSTRFSNFSQGPAEDEPKLYDEPDESVTPQPQSRPTSSSGKQFNTLAATRLAPGPEAYSMTRPDSTGYATSATGYETAMETASTTTDADTVMADDEESPRQSFAPVPAPALGSKLGPTTQPENEAADRWAQIRKNAAERKVGEENAPRLRNQSQSQSVETEKTDDGETSGEETIESRVARIKARVAELSRSSQQAAPAAY